MFRPASRTAVVCCVIVLVGLALPQVVGGQDPPPADPGMRVRVEEQEGNRRESETKMVAADGSQVLIGFIDSPTATCYQPDSSQDICYVNWHFLSVSADPAYILWMWVELGGKKASRYGGFFQTSMLVPHTMHGRGFKVACGALGAGGDPDFGNSYAYTIRARDSNDLFATNSGTVYCPAFIP